MYVPGIIFEGMRCRGVLVLGGCFFVRQMGFELAYFYAFICV